MIAPWFGSTIALKRRIVRRDRKSGEASFAQARFHLSAERWSRLKTGPASFNRAAIGSMLTPPMGEAERNRVNPQSTEEQIDAIAAYLSSLRQTG
jgi:hypothetical protein